MQSELDVGFHFIPEASFQILKYQFLYCIVDNVCDNVCEALPTVCSLESFFGKCLNLLRDKVPYFWTSHLANKILWLNLLWSSFIHFSFKD